MSMEHINSKPTRGKTNPHHLTPAHVKTHREWNIIFPSMDQILAFGRGIQFKVTDEIIYFPWREDDDKHLCWLARYDKVKQEWREYLFKHGELGDRLKKRRNRGRHRFGDSEPSETERKRLAIIQEMRKNGTA